MTTKQESNGMKLQFRKHDAALWFALINGHVWRGWRILATARIYTLG